MKGWGGGAHVFFMHLLWLFAASKLRMRLVASLWLAFPVLEAFPLISFIFLCTLVVHVFLQENHLIAWASIFLNFLEIESEIVSTLAGINVIKWVAHSLLIFYMRIWILFSIFCMQWWRSIDLWSTKTLSFVSEPCDFLRIFLRFRPFEPHFLIEFS